MAAPPFVGNASEPGALDLAVGVGRRKLEAEVMRKRRNQSKMTTRLVAMLAIGAAVAFAPVVAGSAGAASDTALAHLKITADHVSVKADAKSSFKPGTDGMVLKQGDTVKTDATGQAEIDYTDGSLTRLAGSTVFTISRLTNERGGRQTQGKLSVGDAWYR